MIIYDTYNVDHGEEYGIILGQLNIDSSLAFWASFIPLIFLCNKCLMITINSTKEMRDDWYQKYQ